MTASKLLSGYFLACVLLGFLWGCDTTGGSAETTAGSATSELVPVTQEGVLFYANNVDAVFERAKKEDKPVFIEIYSETCHVCQSFIPVFKEPSVRDYFNQKYLNYRIEVNSPEFQSFVLSQKIFVPSLPLFLFYTPDRELVHMAMIEANAQTLVAEGQEALDPEARASSYEKRFQAGETDDQLLVDYAMFSKVTMDTAANRKAMELYAKRQPAGSYASETNYLAIQKLLMDVENPMGEYFVNHIDEYKKGRDADQVKNVAENLIMSSLYSSFGNAYGSDKIMKMRDYMIKVGIDKQVARNRVLLPLINAYFRENATPKAVALVNTHLTQVPLKVPDYVYLINHFNTKAPDKSYVPSAETWAANALRLAPPNSQEEMEIRQAMADFKR